jgi:tripeptide aminopeptidase
MFYESRSRDKAKLDKITQEICDHFVNGADKTGCKITTEVSPDYGPYLLDKDAPAIQTAIKAAENLGLPVNLEESGGGSDANHFNTYGVPTVVLSVGMENAHTKDEYIEEKDLYDAARWALEIVKVVAEN